MPDSPFDNQHAAYRRMLTEAVNVIDCADPDQRVKALAMSTNSLAGAATMLLPGVYAGETFPAPEVAQLVTAQIDADLRAALLDAGVRPALIDALYARCYRKSAL